jgi:hypothetical protein
MNGDANQDRWLSVIGRSLAYICLNSEGATEKNIQQKAQFLESLGLSRADAAAMLGTTPASITELHRRARNTKGKRGKAANGAKNKKHR